MGTKHIFLSFIGVALLLLTSCEVEQPEYRGASHFKLESFSSEKINFTMDVSAYNPNKQNIKIRKSKLNLYANGKYIGEAELLKKYTLRKSSTTLDNVPVEIALGEGVLFSLLNLSMAKTVKLRIEGNLKLSYMGLPTRRKIDQTKEVNLKDLGINLRDVMGGLNLN